MARKHKIKILYLETQLDRNIDSRRTQVGFMKELIKNLDSESFEVIIKEIHSRDDLKKFLDYARKDNDIRYIHISSHGYSKKNHCSIYLTKNEEIQLGYKRNLELFKNLSNKIIFFSACQIGADTKIIQKIVGISKADAIFGYSRDIHDAQALIIETLFYHLCCSGKEYYYSTIYEKLKFAIDFLDIDTIKEPLHDPLLVVEHG